MNMDRGSFLEFLFFLFSLFILEFESGKSRLREWGTEQSKLSNFLRYLQWAKAASFHGERNTVAVGHIRDKLRTSLSQSQSGENREAWESSVIGETSRIQISHDEVQVCTHGLRLSMPATAGVSLCIFHQYALRISWVEDLQRHSKVILLSWVSVVVPKRQRLNPRLLERYPSKISQQLQGAPFCRTIYHWSVGKKLSTAYVRL